MLIINLNIYDYVGLLSRGHCYGFSRGTHWDVVSSQSFFLPSDKQVIKIGLLVAYR